MSLLQALWTHKLSSAMVLVSHPSCSRTGLPGSIQGRGKRFIRQHIAQSCNGISSHGRRVAKAREDSSVGAFGGGLRPLRANSRKGREAFRPMGYSVCRETKSSRRNPLSLRSSDDIFDVYHSNELTRTITVPYLRDKRIGVAPFNATKVLERSVTSVHVVH